MDALDAPLRGIDVDAGADTGKDGTCKGGGDEIEKEHVKLMQVKMNQAKKIQEEEKHEY